nr:hypothetical protein [Tanacetum cinerariifolium]
MSKFYTYLWNEMSTSKQKIVESLLSEAFIFVPYSFSSASEVVSAENPPLLSYLQSLQQLSSESLPSQVAKTVFQVFQKWSDGLDSGILSCYDIDFLKKRMEEKEMQILPTVQDLT